ncbi:hypothetical protein [Leptospira yasudae]|uniref:Uncharacterized protein n=1 Tax=Leptospira yasudae TaxID=2202201 RepID=A0A6N4QXH6_9LEPT|nr:hypothetical protein [Leptospira yasudae]TGL76921.1 hypothetical protein EHQ72_12655 [Leptospira yasudae]TGL79683.1 hypothetical protein EHQ77_09800 [Leptospira yasudae]TGL82392.1 hypothetical protein EHQ83_13695 [Leptospira yasudae]
MDRKNLENLSTSIGVISLFVMTITGILTFADVLFKLDLLPERWEKVGFLFIAIFFVLSVSSVLVSIMLNISIIALSIHDFLNLKKKDEHETSD